MKKSILVLAVAVVAILSAYSCTQITAPNSPLPSTPTFTPSATPTIPCVADAVIPDAALAAALRAALAKPSNADICEEELGTITTLSLTGVYDYTGLELCTGLKTLAISGGARVVTQAVKALVDLESLSFYQLNLQDGDLNDINSNSKLKLLQIRYASITSLAPFSALAELEEFNVEYCNINSVAALAAMTQLKRLSVYANAITDISPLSGLTGLWFLNIGSNPITTISGLAAMVNLRDLIMAGCSVTDITAAENMLSLTTVYATANQIADISALTRNAEAGGLGSGNTVYIQSNPLNATPDVDTYIPYLQSRGVNVVY